MGLCPRCGGWTARDHYGDLGCVYCGWYDYGPRLSAAAEEDRRETDRRRWALEAKQATGHGKKVKHER